MKGGIRIDINIFIPLKEVYPNWRDDTMWSDEKCPHCNVVLMKSNDELYCCKCTYRKETKMIKEFVKLVNHKKEVEAEYNAKLKQLEEEYNIKDIKEDYNNMIRRFKKIIPDIIADMTPVIHINDKYDAEEFSETEEYNNITSSYHNFDIEYDEYYFTICDNKIIVYHEVWKDYYGEFNFSLCKLKKYEIDLELFEMLY